MAKNGQAGKEEILANNVAMNLRQRVKGSLFNRDKLRLETAVALLPQVEDTRAKMLEHVGKEERGSCLFHCGYILLFGSTGYEERCG